MSDAERRARADEILRDALDLPTEDRAAYVRAAARGDAPLEAEVLALLSDAATDPASLAPGSALGGAFGGALLRRLEGTEALEARVGPFRVVREIGRGGMGVVYLAERAEGGFSQFVALKIAAPGAASDALARRFERERQIVASLDHPHIARLVDGGRTDDGRPYFAMEFVDGERIDAHADGLRLDVDARLALVRTVAAAVQHAHSRLLVHRDIKPGNILISRAGEVKLLDFGIAKPIGPHPGAGAEPLTRTDVRPMTPEYASPELLRGGPATTASDVYQIGLLLYELLTGVRAQRLGGATASEAERIVCHDDPPLPSAAALGPGGAEARAAARSTTPAALARRLSGDLDAIVMQAIRKEPEARYATPLDLADDIQRALASEPVRARRGTALYRTRKFVRRNRVATAFGATVLALLAGFGLWMTVLYGRASAALARARTAETSAGHEAETARQVSDFLIRLFGVSDPGEARGNTVTARALLDDAAQRIGPELEGQPEVQARLMQVMGQVYINLGLYDAAEPLLRDALAIAERTGGPAGAGAAEALESLGTLAVVRGTPAEGEATHRRALAIREAIGPADGLPVAKSLISLGSCLLEQARYGEAEPLLRRALAIREEKVPDSADVATALNELAEVYNRQARYADAEPLYLRSLGITEKTLGPNHPEIGYQTNNLGLLYKRMGRLDEAEHLYRRALQVREKCLPPDHPLIAWTLDNLGMLCMTEKRYADAEPLFTRALDIAGRAVGPGHPDTAIIMNNLALLRVAQGRTAEAEALHRKTIEIWEKSVGPDHPATAGGLHNLARLCASTGRTGEAARYYRRALAIREAKLGVDHPLTKSTREALEALR
jgi:serine/threonine protein kinase/tetratricopeptide (TPR) repeat protein